LYKNDPIFRLSWMEMSCIRTCH